MPTAMSRPFPCRPPWGTSILGACLLVSTAYLAIGLPALHSGEVARADDRLMQLTVELTREGKKLTPPAPEHPVYYMPVSLGYQERGEQAQHFMRKPVSDEQILQSLVRSLAKKGYLVCSAQFPPTMTITFEWGTVSPVYHGEGRSKRVLNTAEIRGVVLGDMKWDVANRFALHTEEILSLTARHYLLISAYEYQWSNQQKADVLLWCAHSTTDAWGNYLDEVITPLIATAEPALGRETKPGASWIEPVAHVSVGPVEVKDFPAAPEKTK